MRAMVFHAPGSPLRMEEREVPAPGAGEVLLRVHACGLCRTDLHLLDGELAVPSPPRILGHQIVGTVEALGAPVDRGDPGDPREPGKTGGRARGGAGGPAVGPVPGSRVGVPWLAWTCGACEFCRSGRENLCPSARFTGRDTDGGMAEWAVADARFCFPIPGSYPDAQAAPLLCAGLIGYRALGMCDGARHIGLFGFGSSAHILAQVAAHEGRAVYAFTRSGDAPAQELARSLGAAWAGATNDESPRRLEAAIVFAPVGALVPRALETLQPGGTVVCAGIHMSDIPSFPYELLWMERAVRSVANLTRRDGHALLALAPRVPIEAHVTTYPLEAANEALDDLRLGRLTGSAVLIT